MNKLRTLDLFSGIGGFSLGLERTGGFETVAFCEIEPFCQRVLAKHWPEGPIYGDVRELTAAKLAADGIGRIDVICGGFPCQDISVAGRGAGLEGERSGLWFEYARLIGELRPRYVIVENVAALLGRGLGRVLGELATLGYDAEWHCIPAAAVGAPHRRDRVWIIAHAGGDVVREQSGRRIWSNGACATLARNDGAAQSVADADGAGQSRKRPPQPEGRKHNPLPSRKGEAATVCDPDRQSLAVGQSFGGHLAEKLASSLRADRWASEPDVGRVADGIPGRVDRLKSLGNAVVPQIPEIIGQAILAAEAA